MGKNRTVRRTRLIKRSAEKSGLAPGTLVHIGEKRGGPVRVTCLDYDQERFEESQVAQIEECAALKSTPTVTWINVDGLHEIEIVRSLGQQYGLHPLMLEDILHTGQRPKFEDYGECAFVVLRMLGFDDHEQTVESEQVSLVVGSNYVISFQEREGDVFDAVRERIRNAKGKVREMGADYLLYALVDAVVDGYFVILEKVGEKIESMEEQLTGNPTEKILHDIHGMKRQMISLRRSVWPLREVISGLQRGDSSVIGETTSPYLRDVYDHTIQIIDTIESYRDIVSGMLDIYLSVLSNKMNAVMKVLTIIATIFIPLTFVAGVYGMNFKHMPELEWRYGYVAVLAVMAAIALVMIVYFRRKRWL